MPAIAIPPVLREAVYAHARATFPAECCGYLTGIPGARSVDAIVRCTNAQDDVPDLARAHDGDGAPPRGAERGFVIAGAELLAFARSFDGPVPARVVYHSHTNGRAYFSDLDQSLAAGPAYPVEHLVVGIDDEGPREAAQFAWSADAGRYIEIARWSIREAA